MAEQKTATPATQATREQFKVAENIYNDSLRTLNEMTSSATEFGFDLAEKNVRYATEWGSQFERTMKDSLTSYRTLYLESLKSWQGYVQGMTEWVGRNRN